ncbi:MAG TPA: hypothetical protein VFH29_09385 [Anaerolineales bacterium]|nr:hypothetical protein [Anaerolineales bacterium]
MKNDSLRNRVLAVLALILVVLALYALWARPFQLRWGATDSEVRRSMPGDQLNLTPTFLATRAITIQGTPGEIWPWIIQMGYGRAGFYGFDLFESVGSPTGARSAERILPQWQHFNVGDPVPISPVATLKFFAIEPDQYIVWSGEDGRHVFTWALYPVDATHTRLVSRVRWTPQWTQPALLSLDLLTEFTDHLAVRKILQGLQGRVEGRPQPANDVNIEFFIYLAAFLVFIWAALSVLRLPLSWASWLVGLAGGLTWLISWYAPGSIWLGAVLSLLVVWAVRVEFRDVQRLRLAQSAKEKPVLSKRR